MLYYLLFWTILGFIFHFYIIFWTNLLTGGPAQNCYFFAYFSVSKKRNIKQSPNGMKPSGAIFLEQTQPRRLGVDVEKQPRRPRGCKAHPRGGGRAPHPRGPLVAPPTYFFLVYIYPHTPKTSRRTTKPYFHRCNLLYPRDPILEPLPTLRRRRNRPRRASTSSPRPLRWVVSSLPQTFGSIVIS